MKTLAYLDCPTGISGDMCLGALVHAGVPLSYLENELAKLGIGDEFHLSAESVQRNQQAATKVHVKLTVSAHSYDDHNHSHDDHSHSAHNHDDHSHKHPDHSHEHSHEHTHSHGHTRDHSHSSDKHKHAADHHSYAELHSHHGRRLPEIEALIQQADISQRAADWSLAVFRLLAKAEATVHGIPPERVHFHEVGATDAIVDIVGTCLGLDWLGVDEIVCSPLPTGSGTVRCEHGLLPVPAPAVLSMMATSQIPVYGNGIKKELVTPTGCAIAATLSSFFGAPPAITLQTIGLGAGGRDLELPNILRLWIGTVGHEKNAQARATSEAPLSHPTASANREEKSAPETEKIVELQTQIDDCSPQAIAHTFNRLFAVGAVDVFTQSVLMKKNRLGTLMTILCPEDAIAACETVLFTETTTLGIRRTHQSRSVLLREMITVETDYGAIAVKVARAKVGSAVLNVQPEYEDCARVAKQHKVALHQVQQAARIEAIAAIKSDQHTPDYSADV